MADTDLLTISKVSRFRSKVDGQKHSIFDNLDFTIPRAKIIALIGPSGSGKSSLLRILNRLEDADSGQIEFNGLFLGHYNPLELRRSIGLVPQKPFMFPGTVQDNLEYAFSIRAHSLPDMAELTRILHICVADPDWLNQPARKLSVGQQQRVSLARTLLNQPKLLLLDEPTSSLDPDTAKQVLTNLRNVVHTTGMSLLIVSHDHLLARKFADQVLVLKDGNIVQQAVDWKGGYAES